MTSKPSRTTKASKLAAGRKPSTSPEGFPSVGKSYSASPANCLVAEYRAYMNNVAVEAKINPEDGVTNDHLLGARVILAACALELNGGKDFRASREQDVDITRRFDVCSISCAETQTGIPINAAVHRAPVDACGEKHGLIAAGQLACSRRPSCTPA